MQKELSLRLTNQQNITKKENDLSIVLQFHKCILTNPFYQFETQS